MKSTDFYLYLDYVGMSIIARTPLKYAGFQIKNDKKKKTPSLGPLRFT